MLADVTVLGVTLDLATFKTVVLCIGIASAMLWYLMAKKEVHPPGPKGLPLIGNLLQIPREHPWLQYSAWATTYGEIIYLKAPWDHIIILNSAKVAKELLDGRSAIYSDRPVLAMIQLARLDREIPLRPCDEEWRAQRRVVAQSFSPSMLPQYHPIQESESRRLVRNILQSPDNVVSLAKHRIAAIIMRVTYGRTVVDDDDEMVQNGFQGVENFCAASDHGKWLVNVFPPLRFIPRWAPGASFLDIADNYGNFHDVTTPMPYQWCKREVEAGTLGEQSLVANTLSQSDHKRTPEEDATLLCAATAAWGGGLDTNLSAFLTFILAMLHYPHVQAKAQAEIDSVIGTERLPTIADRPSLPYVRSLITEVFRWQPAAPLGLPHALRQDDVYMNYVLPKSSIVIPNIWQMLHDPKVYYQPDAFIPERFNNDDSKMRKVTDLAFGFGRRRCPGIFLAESTIFTIVSTILATCNVVPKRDENGEPVSCDIEYTSGMIVFPKGIVCDIRPRLSKDPALFAEE